MTDAPLEFEGEPILDAVAAVTGPECDSYAPQVNRCRGVAPATGKRDQRWVQSQQFTAEFLARLAGKPTHGDIDPTVGQGGELLPVIDGKLLHRELGARLGEAIECDHRGVVPGDMRHSQRCAAHARQAPDSLKCLKDISSGRQQPLPYRGEADRACVADEQRCAHLTLELADRS